MSVPTTTITTNSAASSSLTITKPSGLALGDLMVAYIVGTSGGSFPLDTPSGWTQLLYDSNQTARKFAVFTKVAASGDVAASDFTFTSSSGATAMLGVLVRCAGVAAGSEITASELDETTSSTNPSFTGASTPASDDSLVLMSLCGWDNGGLVTASAYASTPSKTWTELADLNINSGSIDPFLAVASATSGNTTQITAYTATLSAGPDTIDGTLIIIRPPVNATGTNATFAVSPLLNTQNGTAGTIGTNALLAVSPNLPTQSGKSVNKTQWNNQAKPTVSVVNNLNKP